MLVDIDIIMRLFIKNPPNRDIDKKCGYSQSNRYHIMLHKHSNFRELNILVLMLVKLLQLVVMQRKR